MITQNLPLIKLHSKNGTKIKGKRSKDIWDLSQVAQSYSKILSITFIILKLTFSSQIMMALRVVNNLMFNLWMIKIEIYPKIFIKLMATMTLKNQSYLSYHTNSMIKIGSSCARIITTPPEEICQQTQESNKCQNSLKRFRMHRRIQWIIWNLMLKNQRSKQLSISAKQSKIWNISYRINSHNRERDSFNAKTNCKYQSITRQKLVNCFKSVLILRITEESYLSRIPQQLWNLIK